MSVRLGRPNKSNDWRVYQGVMSEPAAVEQENSINHTTLRLNFIRTLWQSFFVTLAL